MEESNKGIWKYKSLFDYEIPEKDQMTIGEGNTPFDSIPELAKDLSIKNIYLKREDHNPTGSHKDRMTAYMLSAYTAFDGPEGFGKETFVISSSGNAAISLVRYAYSTGYQYKIYAFISEKTPKEKLERLKNAAGDLTISITKDQRITDEDKTNPYPKVFFTSRPVSDAIKFAKKYSLTLLRGSTDKYATQGFRTISKELVDSDFAISDIFIPCSSGTTVAGIHEGYEQLISLDTTKQSVILPKFHAVQTSTVHPISQDFDKSFTEEEESIAQAISDKVSHRKTQIEKIIKATNGFAWTVSNVEIKNAQELLKKYNVICSNEGAMTIAAIIKAKQSGWQIENAACIITGVRNI